MKTIKLTPKQLVLTQSLLREAIYNLSQRIDEDFDNNWTLVKDTYGKRYKEVLKAVEEKFNLS